MTLKFHRVLSVSLDASTNVPGVLNGVKLDEVPVNGVNITVDVTILHLRSV